jgi:GLPGLI family protein
LRFSFFEKPNILRYLPILFVLLFVNPSAQAQSGKVLYEQTIKSTYGNQEFSFQILWEVIFNDSIAVCRYVKPKIKETNTGSISVSQWIPDRKDFYATLFDSKSVLDCYEQTGQFYHVTGSYENVFSWKFTGKQGLVGEYPCIEAATLAMDDSVVVWFSPRIPVPAGPLFWRGLPGLILHMELNGGKNVIALKELDLNYEPKPEDFDLTFPKRTKAISFQDLINLIHETKKKNRELFGEN